MTMIPLEEKNWEEWQQIQLCRAQLCCGDGSQSEKLFSMESEESRQRGWATQKWLGCSPCRLWSWADISPWVYFGVLPPCSAWLCLGGPWNLAQYLSPHLQTQKSWWMWAGAAGIQRTVQVWAVPAAVCHGFEGKHLLCVTALLGLQFSPQKRAEGFCHPSGFGPCCPTLLLCTCVWCLRAPGIPSLALSSQCIPGHLYFTASPIQKL